ncbi:MAG: hypothetical protein AUK48_14600 [Oscillatoriales cyanobacterium CG2_30_44_21]|nr:MAG: hypothetical protein AUK48_14600 [Oscillatoriales cyanobacterium CG2_30_44_21]
MLETITTRKSIFLSPTYEWQYKEASLGKYFEMLINEKTGIPKTDFEKRCLWYREQAIRSFVKASFATFPYTKPRGTKTQLDAEVKLWKSIYSLAQYLKGFNHWEESPELTLCNIIQESALVLLPIFFSGDNEGKQSVDDCICFYQKQNMKLQDSEFFCNNPFDQKTPWTRDFIDKAMHIANQDKNFRSQHYLPVVQARKALTAVIKKEKTCSFTEQGRLKSGRKRTKNI